MIFADHLVANTFDGELLELVRESNIKGIKMFEKEFANGEPDLINALTTAVGIIYPWLASETSDGLDLGTGRLGGLRSTYIPTFDSPAAHLLMVQW